MKAYIKYANVLGMIAEHLFDRVRVAPAFESLLNMGTRKYSIASRKKSGPDMCLVRSQIVFVLTKFNLILCWFKQFYL